jgi:hypothetical protein
MAPPRRRPLRGGPACRDPRSACHSCPTEHAHDHRSRCTRGEQGRDDVASQLLASGLRRSRAGAVVCSSVRQRPVAAADWTAFTLFVPVQHHATAHASQLLDPDRMGGAGPQLVGCPGLRGGELRFAWRRHLRRCWEGFTDPLIADLAWSELFSESVDRFLRIAPERRRRAGFHARREP